MIIMGIILGISIYKYKEYKKFINTSSVVECSLNSSFKEYDSKEIVTGSFKGDKLYKFDVEIDINLKKDYLEFKDLFIKTIKEKLKTEGETEFNLETIDTKSGVKFKASYNEEQYSSKFGEAIYNSEEYFREYLEKEGYTCN